MDAPDRVLGYIDERIEQPLTPPIIARYVGYSTYHYGRVFAGRMGMPLGEYLRLRRMEYAVADLLAGMKMIDIAIKYGFETHEGFTRAFKRVYGSPPSHFRARYEKPYEVPPCQWRNERNGGIPLEVNFVERPEKQVVGYVMHTTPGSKEIPAFWCQIMQDGRWERLMRLCAGENYGVCIHPEAMMAEGKMDYMIAFDYDGHSQIDEDMELFTVPAATYAVFRAAMDGGAADDITNVWGYVYSEWLPNSEYVYDGDKPDFEIYPCGEECFIHIPVIRKQA